MLKIIPYFVPLLLPFSIEVTLHAHDKPASSLITVHTMMEETLSIADGSVTKNITTARKSCMK